MAHLPPLAPSSRSLTRSTSSTLKGLVSSMVGMTRKGARNSDVMR